MFGTSKRLKVWGPDLSMKTHPSFSFVLAAGALVCLCRFGAAQRPSTAQSSTVTGNGQPGQVTISVMVIDKKGAIVKNLTASDFTLTQDSRPQVIQSFTTKSTVPFRLGLLVDTGRTVMGAMDAERKASEKFVGLMLPAAPSAGAASGGSSSPATQAVPGSEAFLIHFDREVELLEDFTGSPEKLDREIDEMGPTSGQHDNPQGPESTGDDRGSGQSQANRNGTQLYDAIYLASDDLMKSKSGRKALVVFSDGADHGSKETLNDAIDAADRANLEICTIYFKGEEERQQNGFPGGRRGGWPGGGGGGYPGGGGWPGGGGGYPGGGGGGRRGPASEAGVDGRKIMQDIAQRTGGMFFEAKKKDNLDEIYGLVASGLEEQYLLTYTPDKADSEGDFHKIALKANNPDYTLEVREGYYPPSNEKYK
jgi:VWFA-related protein